MSGLNLRSFLLSLKLNMLYAEENYEKWINPIGNFMIIYYNLIRDRCKFHFVLHSSLKSKKLPNSPNSYALLNFYIKIE